MKGMANKGFDKEIFKKSVVDNVKNLYRRTIDEATPNQVFQAVAYAVKDVIIDEWIATHKEYEKKDVKTVYYLSMEFLMGRALGNNIISIMARQEVREALDELGFDLNVIEDQEPDAALGNGGLGRSWIPLQPSDTRHTAAASVTTMVCSNRKLKTVIRSRCRITG